MGPGSIQCSACTATTMSAHPSGSPVACDQPGPTATLAGSPAATARARMSALGSTPTTRPAQPAHQRDERPVPLPRSTTVGDATPA